MAARLIIVAAGSAAYVAGACLVYLIFPLSSRLSLSATYVTFAQTGPSFALLVANLVIAAFLSAGVLAILVRRADAVRRTRLGGVTGTWPIAKASFLAIGWITTFWIYPMVIMSSAVQHIYPLELAMPVGAREIDVYFVSGGLFLLAGLLMAAVDAIFVQRTRC